MKRKTAGIFTVLLPLLAAAAVIFKDSLFGLSKKLPPCFFYKRTGLLCPACGNTRCVSCLLKGKFLKAWGYNITPPIVIIVCLIFYIELAAYSFGKDIKIYPRKNSFTYALIFLVTAYYILRNFLPFLTIIKT